MRTLQPTPEDCNELLMALIKTRSISKENGNFDVLEMLEPLTVSPGTVDMLSGLIDGTKKLDRYVWFNLSHLLQQCPTWNLSLAVREVEMPTPEEVYKTFTV